MDEPCHQRAREQHVKCSQIQRCGWNKELGFSVPSANSEGYTERRLAGTAGLRLSNYYVMVIDRHFLGGGSDRSCYRMLERGMVGPAVGLSSRRQ
jgi:hypothetical protein